MPCVALSYEIYQAILSILCNISQKVPGNHWPHVLLFHSSFSVLTPALVTQGGCPRNVGSKDEPPHSSLLPGILLLIKNTPKGNCQNFIFFLCIIFNFPFWVRQWAAFSWVFWTHLKPTVCSLFFFYHLPSFGISAVGQVALKKKGQTQKKQHIDGMMGEKNKKEYWESKPASVKGQVMQESSPNLHLCDQHWSPGSDQGKTNFPPKLRLLCCANHSPTAELWQLNVVKLLNFHW